MMVDTNQGQNMKPETKTQEMPMPSVNQKTPEVVAQPTAGTDVSQATGGETTTTGLPDTASDRTRREFDKLTSQLREERDQRMRLEDIFKSLTAQPAVPQVQTPPVYDPQTGLINESVLSETQKAAQEAKKTTEELRAEVARYKQELEAREAFTVYPELDPTARAGKPFDRDLHVQTRRILTDSMLNPQDYGLASNQRGRGLTFKEAADLAKKQINRKIEEVKQEAAQETVESLTPKEQASMAAEGTSQRVPETTPLEEENLLMESRKGNINALAARVARLRKQSKS